MTIAQTSDLWWKSAIVYCLDVETFADSNADGIGDFTGLTDRLDYLAGVGFTCLWLMPFYPSPNRDDGYDVSNFYDVDRRLGSLGDFVVFMRTAKDRGLRVIVDLVVNHTSDQHPWFRSARRSPRSPFRDFYIWRDQPSAGPAVPVVFPDAEDDIWSWDEKAEQYYLHNFYRHQPDLNIGNEKVRDEISKIAGFWLELGVDGFRVDAVPFLVDTDQVKGKIDLNPHRFLHDLRSFISRRGGQAFLLGEVNLPYPVLRKYFGDEGEEIDMLFDFIGMQRIHLSLVRKDARPLASSLAKRPPHPKVNQWANFLRNHDELTLDKLTEKQRQEVFDAFGPDEGMQLFGRGIRRRMPTMLEGDEDRLRLAYSLLFSLPGTPVLYYGEEIGMGENLDIPGRLSVRTPMQWSDDRNGGFSDAQPHRLFRPVAQGRYGPAAVNVADQQKDPDSLLLWMERIIRTRKETPEIGWSQPKILETSDHAVMAHRCDWEGKSMMAVHNFSDEPKSVRVKLDRTGEDDQLHDLLEDGVVTPEIVKGSIELKLDLYGYRWFRIQS
jgi:trehalose synthase